MAHTLDRYVAEWESNRNGGGAPDPLARTRRDALDRFLALGFPTTRDEEWRFTSVAPIAERTFALAKDGAAAAKQHATALSAPR